MGTALSAAVVGAVVVSLSGYLVVPAPILPAARFGGRIPFVAAACILSVVAVGTLHFYFAACWRNFSICVLIHCISNTPVVPDPVGSAEVR